jgi:O-antigen/teichoic acid export membrane protein
MRRSVRNLGLVLTSDVLSRLLGFLAVYWLARRLGVENFGVIGFALAALSYGIIVTDLGLLKLGTREVARNPGETARYAGTVILLRVLLAFIALAVIGVFALAVPRAVPVRVVIFTYGFSLLPIALTLEWVFQGREELEHVAISRLLLMAVYSTLTLVLVRRPQDVLLVPLLWLTGNAVSALYLFIVYRTRVGRLGLTMNLRFWGELLKSGLPLGVGTILSQVYMNFGLLMLGVLAIGEYAGWFTAAQRLVYFVLVIDRAFYMVAFPVISRRLADPARPEAKDVMQHLAKLVLLVTIPIAVGTLPLARMLMSAVFGPNYVPAAPVLAVLVWLAVTTTMNSLYAYGLVATGREKHYARNISIGTIVVLGLSLLLVPLANALGAAIALVAGEVVMLVLMFRDFRQVLRVGFLRDLWRPLVAAAIPAVAIRVIGPERIGQWFRLGALSASRQEQLALLFTIILTIAIYLVILYLVRGVGEKEFALLRAGANDPGPGAMQDGAQVTDKATKEADDIHDVDRR